MEKLDNARKAILSRLEQLEVKEKPREMAQVRIDFLSQIRLPTGKSSWATILRSAMGRN